MARPPLRRQRRRADEPERGEDEEVEVDEDVAADIERRINSGDGDTIGVCPRTFPSKYS
jgi:hypothetical protein